MWSHLHVTLKAPFVQPQLPCLWAEGVWSTVGKLWWSFKTLRIYGMFLPPSPRTSLECHVYVNDSLRNRPAVKCSKVKNAILCIGYG